MAYLQLLQTLKAASNDGEHRPRLVRPVDLDIYYEPEIESIPASDLEPPTVVLKYVSALRKKVWRFKDVTVSTYNKTENAVTGAKQAIVDAYEMAKSDPLSAVRPGCIMVATLAGTVVHGRGRKPFRRLATAGIAGAFVAGVAYPDKAAKVGKAVYHKGMEASTSLVQMIKNMSETSKEVKAVKDIAENRAQNSGNIEKEMESIQPIKSDAESETELKEKGDEGNNLVVLNANGEEVCLIDVTKIENETVSKAGTDEINQNQIDSLIERKVSDSGSVEGVSESEGKENSSGEQKIEQGETGETEKNNDNNKASSLKGHNTSESIVDYGQSSPEDQDMYSTRS